MAGVENPFTTTGHMNCAISLAGRKIHYFYAENLPLSNYEQ